MVAGGYDSHADTLFGPDSDRYYHAVLSLLGMGLEQIALRLRCATHQSMILPALAGSVSVRTSLVDDGWGCGMGSPRAGSGADVWRAARRPLQSGLSALSRFTAGSVAAPAANSTNAAPAC